MSALARAGASLRRADLHKRSGRVNQLIGLVVESTGLEAEVGEVCLIETGRDQPAVPAEVVGFRGSSTLLMPLGEMQGIGPGKTVTATGEPLRIPVGDGLLGRMVDGLGRPIDGQGSPARRQPALDRRPPARSRSPARASPSASASACAPSTGSCPADAASGWASSPARAWASPRCWA